MKQFLQIQKLWSSDLNYSYTQLIFLETYHSENFQVANTEVFIHAQTLPDQWTVVGTYWSGQFLFLYDCWWTSEEFPNFFLGIWSFENWQVRKNGGLCSWGSSTAVLKATSERETLPWGLKTVSELVRSFYLILQKSRWVRSECMKPQRSCLNLNGQVVRLQGI